MKSRAQWRTPATAAEWIDSASITIPIIFIVADVVAIVLFFLKLISPSAISPLLVLFSSIPLITLSSSQILEIAPGVTSDDYMKRLRILSEFVLPLLLVILLGLGAIIIGNLARTDTYKTSLIELYLLLYLPLAASVAAGPSSARRSFLQVLVPASLLAVATVTHIPNKIETTVIYLALTISTTFVIAGLSNRLRQEITRQSRLHEQSQNSADLWSSIALHARTISALESPEKILNEIAAAASSIGFDMASICLLNKEQRTIRFAYPRGLPETLLNRDFVMQDMSALILNTRQTTVADYSSLKHPIPSLKQLGLRTTIALPLWVNGEVNAILAAGSLTLRNVHEEEIAALELLAATAGSALEQRNLTTELIADVNRLYEVLETAPNATVVVDEDNDIVLANRRAGTLFGREGRDLLKHHISEIIPLGNAWYSLLWEQDAPWETEPLDTTLDYGDNNCIDVELIASRLEVSERKFVSISVRDITAQKLRETQLLDQNNYDLPTGLPNKAKFLEDIKRALARSRHHDNPVTVALFDICLPRSARVTQSEVDAVMAEIARELNSVVRDSDILARMGDLRFGLLIERLIGSAALTYLRQIMDISSQAVDVTDNKLHPASHFGVAFGSYGDDPGEIVGNAEIALNRHNDSAQSAIAFYDENAIAEASERLEIEAALYQAEEKHEFSLHYQPVISLEDQSTIMVEALLRWKKEGDGFVSPSRFIHIAEETGIIRSIGAWALNSAGNQYNEWRRSIEGLSNLKLSINISRLELHPDLIISHVRKLLHDTGIPPQNLVTEITETALLTNLESAKDTLHQLSRLGISIAVDDFGTGYSSLSMLTLLPVNILKIDKSFVDQLGTRSDLTVEAILRLAEQLDLMVIAEGVETNFQKDRLVELGCKYAQGFLFSKPLPPAELLQFVTRQPPPA